MVLEPKLCDFTHTVLFVWPSNTINYMQCLIGIFLYELTYQHIRSWISSLIANWFWFRRSTFNVFNSLNLQLKAHISINSCIICDLSSVLILVHSETCMPLPPMRCSFLIPLTVSLHFLLSLLLSLFTYGDAEYWRWTLVLYMVNWRHTFLHYMCTFLWIWTACPCLCTLSLSLPSFLCTYGDAEDCSWNLLLTTESKTYFYL